MASKFVTRWSNASTGSETSEVDIVGVDNTTDEVFMNIQKDLVRINNNVDTLATKGYARSVGGGGGGYTTLAQFVSETNWTTGYINGSGDYTALTVGAANTVFLGNGVTSAPSWGTVPNAALSNSTISGVALGSNLASLTLADATLTLSGSYNGSNARTLQLNLSSTNTWAADQSVPDEAYHATNWDGSMEVPTKNAIRDKIESITGGANWNGLIQTFTSGDMNSSILTEGNTLTVHTGGTASSSLTLLSATGGNVLYLINAGTGNWTISRQSSDNIFYHGASVTSFVLAPGQSCWIKAINGYWNVSLDGYNPSAGSSTFASLTDVNLTSITTNDFLKWDGTDWINRSPSQVRTDLTLVIGTNVQAWDADLDTWAGKTPYAGSITITTAKTFNVTNSLTLSGTDGTTMTFPTTTATIARTDAAQTFTGSQTYSGAIITTNNAITASGNAATVPVTAALSTVTNNSAATLTITMTTTSAVDGQLTTVRIVDFSAAAQTITWVNTENSGIAIPTTTNGSTTLPLTVKLRFNTATTKWRLESYN